MSFSSRFLGVNPFSFRRRSGHDRECDGNSSFVNLASSAGVDERRRGIKQIRNGCVTKLKLTPDFFDIVSENASSLASTLTDLVIRPVSRGIDNCHDGGDEGWESSFEFGIDELPRELANLTNLKSFLFENNGKYPTHLTFVLTQLPALEVLTLLNCGIKCLSDLTNLSESLSYIDLGQNLLEEIPTAIYKLQKLKCLILSQNKLQSFPRELSGLISITKLDLSHNKITEIPKEICKLKFLSKLYLLENRIEYIPKEINELTRLKDLNLSNNRLKCLPETIGQLFNLRLLALTYNNLTSLPESICDLNVSDDALLLGQNPFHMPPIEICTQGKNAIKGFFEASKKSRGINCKRVKMVLLGETLAGKTSLARALVEGRDANVPEEDRTVGLDTYFWRPRPHEDGPELEVLIVDCAGQRKYLLTHQFFLTEGAIFLLVVDLDKYVMKPENYKTMVGDWINIVSSHVPGAVIQIVPTRFDKFDEEADVEQACQDIIKNIERDLEEKIKNLDLEIEKIRKLGDPHHCLEELTQLRDVRPHLPKYFAMPDMDSSTQNFDENTLKIIPVSCKENLKGLLQLKEEILRMIDNKHLCPIADRQVPDTWIKFEEKIKHLKEVENIPMITVEELAKIGESEEFDFSPQIFSAALSYLNAIGSLAHFGNVQQAKHLVFLDPSWLVQLLQLVFRHDHATSLCYKEKFSLFNVTEDQFDQDKELLLENGKLSKTLLRCIWEKIANDEGLIENLIEILDHFSIICKLPVTPADPETLYFITWFLADAMPSNAIDAWDEFSPESHEQLITRVDVVFSILPSSIFERYLIYVLKESDICAPWKSGFFAKKGKSMVLCKVTYGKNSSSVELHSRFLKGYVTDVWLTVLQFWKQFKTLVDEWRGLKCCQSYSICPNCVTKRKEKPKLFPVNWFEERPADCAVDSVKCHKCLSLVDAMFVMPNQDILQRLNGEMEGLEPQVFGPLSSIELSKVAEMIGSSYSTLARNLELTESDIETALHNWPHKHYEVVMELLNKWRERLGQADREILIQALQDMQTPKSEIIHYLKTGIFSLKSHQLP